MNRIPIQTPPAIGLVPVIHVNAQHHGLVQPAQLTSPSTFQNLGYGGCEQQQLQHAGNGMMQNQGTQILQPIIHQSGFGGQTHLVNRQQSLYLHSQVPLQAATHHVPVNIAGRIATVNYPAQQVGTITQTFTPANHVAIGGLPQYATAHFIQTQNCQTRHIVTATTELAQPAKTGLPPRQLPPPQHQQIYQIGDVPNRSREYDYAEQSEITAARVVQNATAELLGSQQQMAPVSSPHELPITLYSDCQKLADVARRLYKKEKYQEAKSICKKMVSALKINAQQIDEIEANELAMANDDAMDIDDSNSQVAVEVDDSAQAQRAAVKIRIRDLRVTFYILLAKISFKQANVQRCIQYATHANTLNRKNASVYKIFGDCYQQNANFARAIKNYKYALYLNPQLVEAKIQMGHCYYKEKQHVEAVKAFTEVLEVYPELTDLYTYINKAYSQIQPVEVNDEMEEIAEVVSQENMQGLLMVQHTAHSGVVQMQHTQLLHKRNRDPSGQSYQLTSEARRVSRTVTVAQHGVPSYLPAAPQTATPVGAASYSRTDTTNHQQPVGCQPQHTILIPQQQSVQPAAAAALHSVVNAVAAQAVANAHHQRQVVNQQNVAAAVATLQALNVVQQAVQHQQVVQQQHQQPAIQQGQYHYHQQQTQVTAAHRQYAEYLNNIASVKRNSGAFDEAIQLYKKTIDTDPGFAIAHSNLAATLQQIGNLQEALTHYKLAIQLDPHFPDAYSNMGNTFKELGDHAAAIDCYSKAIKLNPKFADAHSNLGAVYKDTGNHKLAIQAYSQALLLNPNFCDAYCNLAHSRQMICDWSLYDEQLIKVHQIVRDQLKKREQQDGSGGCTQLWVPSVHPHHAMLYPTLTLEMSLSISKCHAQLAQQKMISMLMDPRHAGQSDRSQVIVNQKYVDFYIQSIKQTSDAFAVRDGVSTQTRQLRIGFVSSDFGNHPTAHLTRSIFGALATTQPKRCLVYCYALAKDDGTLFRKQIEEECDRLVEFSGMSAVDMAAQVSADKIDILINMNGYTKGAQTELFALRAAPIQAMWLGYPGGSGAEYMDYLITDEVTTPNDTPELKYSSGAHMEKMAYLSRCFFIGDHAQMFRHLNNRIIINSPVLAGQGSTTRTVLHTSSGQFKRIEQEILGDPTGATNLALALENMCISNQPMVKIAAGGGMNVLNGTHILAADKLSASGERCAMCDYPPNGGADKTVEYSGIVTSRFQYGLPLDKVVYCNFNQLYKIDPTCVNMWCQILRNVPNSVIWLLRFPAAGEQNMLDYVRQQGIDPNRIIFTNVACKEEHCRRGCLADVCLDTTLCNGHTTGLDILWTGCPMVTLPRATFPSRVAASQLASLGCRDLIASSEADYVKIASRLGNDAKYRAEVRQRVWEQRTISPLFNVKHYARNLDAVFVKMFRRYQNNFRKTKLPQLYSEIKKSKSLKAVLNYINTQVDDGDVYAALPQN